MKKKTLPDLSKAEYDVLRILWKQKQLSVREVHDAISDDNHWAYTTTKTVMDRMVAKKLLSRGSFHGVYIYKPLISRPIGLARLVQYFADRVFESDYESVISMFANHQSITAEEIEELNKILNQEAENEKSKS